MGCGEWREALSARLDGEERADHVARVDAHLAECPACRRWYDDAALVTRLARISPAVAVPGVPGRVLDAAPGPRRSGWVAVLRIVLGVVGAGQVLLGVAQVAGPAMGGMSGGRGMDGASVDHLVHESAAWNLAVGAGFLFIAWRRSRPAGALPILTAFVSVLTLICLDDLVAGTVSARRLSSHALLLIGYAIVVALCRPWAGQDGPAGTGNRRDAPRWRPAPPAENVVELRPHQASSMGVVRARDRGAA